MEGSSAYVKDKLDWTPFGATFNVENIQEKIASHRVALEGDQPAFVLRGRFETLDNFRGRKLAAQLFDFWQRYAKPSLYSVSYPVFQAIARLMSHPVMIAESREIDNVLGALWEREVSLLKRLRADDQEVRAECEARIAERCLVRDQLIRQLLPDPVAPNTPSTHAFSRTGPVVPLQCRDGTVSVCATALEPYKAAMLARHDILRESSVAVVENFAAYAERRVERLFVPMHLVADLCVFCRTVGAIELYDCLVEALPSQQLVVLAERQGGDKLLISAVAQHVLNGSVRPEALTKVPAKTLDRLLAFDDRSPVWGQLVTKWLEANRDFDAAQYQRILSVLAKHAYRVSECGLAVWNGLSWQTLHLLLSQPQVILDSEDVVRIISRRLEEGTVRFEENAVDTYLDLHSWTESQFVQWFGSRGAYRDMLSAGRRQAWMEWYQTGRTGKAPAVRFNLSPPPTGPVGAKPGAADPLDQGSRARANANLVDAFAAMSRQPVRQMVERSCLDTARAIVGVWKRADISEVSDEHYRSLLELGYRLAWMDGNLATQIHGCAQVFMAVAAERARAQARVYWEATNQDRIAKVEADISSKFSELNLKRGAVVEVAVPPSFYDWTRYVREHGAICLASNEGDGGVRMDPRMLPPKILEGLQRRSAAYPRAAIEAVINHYTGIGFGHGAEPVILASLWRELDCVDQVIALADVAVAQPLDVRDMVRWLQAVQDTVVLKSLELKLAAEARVPNLRGITRAQLSRIAAAALFYWEGRHAGSDRILWERLASLYESYRDQHDFELLESLMGHIRWEQCTSIFYNRFGSNGSYAAALSDVMRERWTEFLGGHGERPIAEVARLPFDYAQMDKHVLGMEYSLVRPQVVQANVVDGLWVAANEGELPVTGDWYLVQTHRREYVVAATWDSTTGQIEVRFRGCTVKHEPGNSWTGYSFAGREINSFVTESSRDEGTRVAVFTGVTMPDGGCHIVSIK